MNGIVALDLFAGTGWGVACQRLGIEEFGVELMEEAVQTRTANGMKTILRDVWDGLDDGAEMLLPEYNLLIASPPCQTFSMAGSGSGRKALDEVIEAIQLEAYKRPADLKAFGELHDDRTALVLTPLAYVYRDRPKYVAMEQVPTVLPVWEACAKVMRGWGYEVKTAILHAEQYGVPQTRKRAILVAKLDAYVDLPTPTHSRYYPTNPAKLDPNVLKWVSMAEALGWGRTVPSPTYCNSGHGGAGIEWGGNSVRKAMREQSVTEEGWIRKDNAEPGTNDAIRVTPEDAAALQSYPTGRGLAGRPSPTITGGGTDAGGAEPIAKYHERYTNAPDWQGSTDRLSTDEAAALQTYPTALRSNYGTNGDAQNRGERTIDQPAPTVTSKADRNKWDGDENLTAEEAAALQTYPSGRGLTNRPSPTIVGTSGNGGPQPLMKFRERVTSDPNWVGDDSTLTTDEASALQTYPNRPFIWKGTKTKIFLQIGNAVPPLLAQHILAALLDDSMDLL